MSLELNSEILDALHEHPERPVRVLDAKTQKVYLVVAEDSLPTLWQQYFRIELEKGLADIERGDVAEWNVEETIAKASARRAARNS